MITFPNAKINLGLNVVEKRADGYHNIETVFYPINLTDALEIMESGKFSFALSGIYLESPSENNLVVKAYHLLKDDFDLPPVSIHLHKVIPTGAGLGGGSSDGAFMLKMLNSFFSLGLESVQLENYASQLGADCAFFIKNSPALATGIGNILSPIAIGLSNYKIVLVKPPFSVPTAEAYKNITPVRPTCPLEEITSLPVTKWKDILKNDFEDSVFESYPEIKQIKEKFYQAGALYSSMSGSGSAVYGIFPVLPALPEISFNKSFSIYR